MSNTNLFIEVIRQPRFIFPPHPSLIASLPIQAVGDGEEEEDDDDVVELDAAAAAAPEALLMLRCAPCACAAS